MLKQRALHRQSAAAARLSTPLFYVALGGCAGPSVLSPHGTIAAANRTILLNSLSVMLLIVLPTIIGLLLVAWWFRASNGKAQFRPHFTFSGRLELLIWSVPFLVILFLSGIIWTGSHRLDPYKPLPSGKSPLEVQVVSLDWKWLFIYPDLSLASVNELVIPDETPVHLSLTSDTVMNSFFVPQLGSMVAVMYGMRTELNLMAEQPGVFYGQSTQFSGQGFSDMNFRVRSMPPDAFKEWVTALRRSDGVLDLSAFQALQVPSQNVSPTFYGKADPALFSRILSGKAAAPQTQAQQSTKQGQEAKAIAR